jgi:hypothetical protein
MPTEQAAATILRTPEASTLWHDGTFSMTKFEATAQLRRPY